MATYQKVASLLGKDLAAILELCKKLFITWNLDSKKFFSTINHLKKDQIIGLMDGSYEVVKKVKEEVKKLFVFTNFFYTRTGLFVYEDKQMQLIRNANKTPKEYVSVEGLEPAFDLPKDMYDFEIIQKLGGEDKVRASVVDMSQIEQLIENQWGGKAGIMLNDGKANIFYVLVENDQLFAVRVNWRSVRDEWYVSAYELDEYGNCRVGDRFFSNKSQFCSLPSGTITKKVTVNRSRTNQQAIDATGRAKYLNDTVVADMPTGDDEKVEIHFIPFKKQLSVSNLEKKVDQLGFKLVDPVALCAANEQDPSFADKHPNGTQWRDKNGKVCSVVFSRSFHNGRLVDVGRRDGWYDGWFLACVR